VRIGDDVRAQHKLVTERCGLEGLAPVVGGSMGAPQTYEWVARFPDMVKRAATMAGTARSTVHFSLFIETLVEAITSDPGFTRVSMRRPRTSAKACCVTPKCGQ
jgi:homoserine O-acetyltransferase